MPSHIKRCRQQNEQSINQESKQAKTRLIAFASTERREKTTKTITTAGVEVGRLKFTRKHYTA